jgi:ribosomal protein S18 acetylase RimI-like enzyme
METPVKISSFLSRNVQIRPVTVEDYKSLAAVEYEATGGKQWGRFGFQRYLKCGNVVGFVAHSGGSCVGFLLASQQETFVEVDYVAIRPEFQRQGIGTRLMIKAMNALSAPLAQVRHKDGDPKNNDLSNLRLVAKKVQCRLTATVHEKNVAAQLFLRSVGFTVVNYFSEVREDGCDAYGFVLNLP